MSKAPNTFEDLTINIEGTDYKLFAHDGRPQLYMAETAQQHPEYFKVSHYAPAGDFAILKAADELYKKVYSVGLNQGRYEGRNATETCLQQAWQSATVMDRLKAVWQKVLPTQVAQETGAPAARRFRF
ncbi:MAG: hypothetical protein H6867_10725 [Rhodospirillales bacterium]|nr:hypothetical protein [Rhodospirillales bacterium]MCB9995745.1 hypothetical protein [Rhodospirillales bacterium]